MQDHNVYSYIQSEQNSWGMVRVPLTNSKDWNMKEHIERCLNVSNGWFHQGKNDGLRASNDIVTPIIDVAFHSENFDVKDIVPYVDDISQSRKSFLVKKFHPGWAKKYQLDTFIDEVVETSVIYDLVLVKDINNVRPEVVKLQDIAFCDQTDILSGPICLRHEYSISDLLSFKGKWDNDKIDEVIIMAKASKKVSTANNQEVKTPGKYIECFELSGSLPESWLIDGGDPNKYVDSMFIVNYYTTSDGNKQGITLYKGKDKKLTDKFKALKIDTVRSPGRACGRSLVERLFDPQVWSHYSAIKIKKMLDSAVNLIQTDSEEYGNKKISSLKENTVLKHEPGRPLTRMDMQLQNVQPVKDFQDQQETRARLLGSASEASLGINPSAGTPFALQSLIAERGDSMHIYRQGKIATFFSDVLYPEMILPYLVADMNKGQNFSEELTLDELQDVANDIAIVASNERIKDLILQGQVVTKEQQTLMMDIVREGFKKGGDRKFFEIVKDDIKDIPVKVRVNVAGKQKYLARNAEALSNLIRQIMVAPEAFKMIPGLGKAYNQLIESSGMNPIDFSEIVMPEEQAAPLPMQPPAAPVAA